MRAESLLNADDGVNQTGIRIQTNVRRHSESHWLPVLVRCISGTGAPMLFLVELGATTKVASTAVPASSFRAAVAMLALMVASSGVLGLWSSSR